MEFNDREPIYIQIIEDFKRKIINGTYQPGQEVPSRRELAKRLGVNPNTVQRAYKEMEDNGLIQTARGQGSYLTESPEIIQSVKQEMIGEMVRDFIDAMQALGINSEEIIKLVREDLQQQ